MGGEREKIDAEQTDIDHNFTEALYGIAMGEPACLTNHGGGLCDGLNNAGLIIGEHQS